MEKIISSTEIVRDFSTILNKVKFSGEHYVIKRNGKSVARIIPADEKKLSNQLYNLNKILNKLPKLGDELDSFSDDLLSISNDQPEISDDLNWA
ncbi:MAG: type II toxin-antitoxin system Phd/YefM family antitoxin [Deltaproteobacteria bacterium]|nr:type II toxin-antitoxin system Phd/YefM family antitoxin [Deltaproteobacteria bacterium]